MELKHWQDVEKDWKFYFDEGKSYFDTCQKLSVKKGVFDNEFIFNLSVLAGERLLLGLLLSYDYIPSSTSLGGMLQEGKSLFKLNDELLEGAQYIYSFQAFCSLDVAPLTVPNDEELTSIINYIRKIAAFSEENISKKVRVA